MSSAGRFGIAASSVSSAARRLPFRRLEFRHFRLRRGDLGAEIFGRDAILARHRRADLLRGGVAALLRALKRRDRRPALFVERDQRFGARARPRRRKPFVKGFGILADRSDIVHDPTSKRQGAPHLLLAGDMEREASHYQNAGEKLNRP